MRMPETPRVTRSGEVVRLDLTAAIRDLLCDLAAAFVEPDGTLHDHLADLGDSVRLVAQGPDEENSAEMLDLRLHECVDRIADVIGYDLALSMRPQDALQLGIDLGTAGVNATLSRVPNQQPGDVLDLIAAAL